MKLKRLVDHLTNPQRIGLTTELATELGVASADTTRGRLLAESADDTAHLGVYLLGCYVVDDAELWGDAEVYWWAIPALVDGDGKVQKSALAGLPTGAKPHKCGDHEWMTNLQLGAPPLLAVIPPSPDVAECIIRLGFYDDDGEIADMPAAMTQGLKAWAGIASEPLGGPEQLIAPVRKAIWKALEADDDDILMDQDVPIRRGEVVRFGRGLVGAVINSMARVYYVVRDEERTLQFGPISLERGEVETISFEEPMKRGGRLAVFARGAELDCPDLGDLTTDVPFRNVVLTRRMHEKVADGFEVIANGPAKLVAFYTPPPKQ